MAYDEGLAERIRSLLEGDARVTEKRMFGGVAFLLGGNMFVGIVKDDLMVRVGRDGHEEALQDSHARPMDFTGKAMTGYVFVSPEGTAQDAELDRWVGLGKRVAVALLEQRGRARRVAPKRRASRARPKG